MASQAPYLFGHSTYDFSSHYTSAATPTVRLSSSNFVEMKDKIKGYHQHYHKISFFHHHGYSYSLHIHWLVSSAYVFTNVQVFLKCANVLQILPTTHPQCMWLGGVGSHEFLKEKVSEGRIE